MARRPILEIDGVVYKNVYEISYELYTAKDETGHSRKPGGNAGTFCHLDRWRQQGPETGGDHHPGRESEH